MKLAIKVLVKHVVVIIGVGFVLSSPIINLASAQQAASTVLHMQSLQAEIADLRDMIERQDYRIRKLQQQVDGLSDVDTQNPVSSVEPQIGISSDINGSATSNQGVSNYQESALDNAYFYSENDFNKSAGQQHDVNNSAAVTPIIKSKDNTTSSEAYPPVEERIVGNSVQRETYGGSTTLPQPEHQDLSALPHIDSSRRTSELNGEPNKPVIPLPELIAGNSDVKVAVEQQLDEGDLNGGSISVSQQLMPVGPELDKKLEVILEETYYQEGFALLKESKHGEAVDKFKQLIVAHPNGDLVDDANYWIAESMYVNRRLNVSKEYFKVIIDNHKSSSRLPDAMLKTAYIEQEQGNKIEARILLQEIIQFHPRSNAAISAKNRISQLN